MPNSTAVKVRHCSARSSGVSGGAGPTVSVA